MKTLQTIWSRTRSLWRRPAAKREIVEELRFRIEQRTAENIAAGMLPGESAREARKRFSNVQSVREECRETRGANFGETMWQDIRFGLRMLRKNPGFTAIAVLSLALGIGANTAIFSALNAVLLRSLPVLNPHELRLINWVGRNPQYSGYNGPGTSDVPGGFTMGTSFSYPAYCALRDHGTGFKDIFAFSSPRSVTVVGHGEPANAVAMLVSGNYFSGYGAGPLIGRPIVPEDDQPSAVPVALITYRWWEQHCGSDPNVIGQMVAINKTSYTVIGVLPRNYLGPTSGDSSDIYVPLSTQPQIWPTRSLLSADQWWVQIMGRLAPGADEAQVQASLGVLFGQALSQSKTKMDQGGILLEDGSRGQLMLRRELAKPFLVLTAVVGAGLMIRTFANLARVKPGFDPENVLLFRVRPADTGYGERQYFDVYNRIRTAIAAIPGAQAVTFSGFPLVSGTVSSDFIEFQAGDTSFGQKPVIQYLEVGDDFFHTMKIPLLLGRDLSAADTATSPAVAIVNETFARRCFPGENPVGKTFISYHPTTRTVEIVGVARDAKYNRVRADIAPVIYLSQRQCASSGVSFAVRSVLPPFSLLPAVRQAVAAIDPNLPLSMVRTQEEVLKQSVAPDRLFAFLGGALALLAVLLSCVGLYGLMAYNVARRTREIGLRMALGATRRNVTEPILREAVLLAAVGLAIGVPAALALTRLIKSQLYGVEPNDPLTMAAAVVALVVVAMMAAWIPARRAAKVNPMVALRCE